jgi:hypothetical protein
VDVIRGLFDVEGFDFAFVGEHQVILDSTSCTTEDIDISSLHHIGVIRISLHRIESSFVLFDQVLYACMTEG